MKLKTEKTKPRKKRGRPPRNRPDVSRYPEGYIRLLAFGDRHYPRNILSADSIILQLAADIEPHIIIDGGDPICADQISSFGKPHADLVGLQAELDGDYEWRMKLTEAAPNARKILLKDNHVTKRLERKLFENPWLEDMLVMKQENLFSLERLGWEVLNKWTWKNTLMFIHGDESVGRGSSPRLPINKARTMVKDFGISVVRFHSHTTGFEVHRRHDGVYLHAIQLGCLEDPDKVNYLGHAALSNWSHSVGVFYLSESGHDFFFVPCMIVNNKAIFGSKLYQ